MRGGVMGGRILELTDFHPSSGPYEVDVSFSADGRKMWIYLDAPSFGGTVLRVDGIARLTIRGPEVRELPSKFVHNVPAEWSDVDDVEDLPDLDDLLG